MKTYVLIKDNQIIATYNQDIAPVLSPNKGEVYELNDPGVPEYDPESEVIEKTSDIVNGVYEITYSVRPKTEYELWVHKEYQYKIRVHATQIPNFAGLAAMLLAQNCPTVQYATGYIDVYLKFILPDHMTLINSTDELTLFEIPDPE